MDKFLEVAIEEAKKGMAEGGVPIESVLVIDGKMEQINLSLSELSFDQKLNLIESIWEDLTKDEPKFESPVWHKEILDDRGKALASGKAKVSDWEVAKERKGIHL